MQDPREKVRVRDTMEVERGDETLATAKKAMISPLRDRFSVDVQGRGDLFKRA